MPSHPQLDALKEEWRPIDGYEGRYEVSDLGRIRSLTTMVETRPGVFRVNKGRIHSPCQRQGYPIVSLRGGLKMPNHYVHRLVAGAFIPNPENKPHINHINSVRNDNRVENLEWCTPAENAQHSARMGRRNPLRGEDCPTSVLTAKQVRSIRRRLGGGARPAHLAREYGVDRGTIVQIKYRKTWNHL